MSGIDPAPLEPVARLVALEDLRRLKARYFRFVDEKRFAELGGLLADDFVYADDAKRISLTRDEFVRFIADRHADSVSVHAGHDPEIDVLTDETATGVWPMTDLVILPTTRNGRIVQRGAGHYHDRYRRGSEGWQVASSHLTRIWLTIDTQQEEFIHA